MESPSGAEPAGSCICARCGKELADTAAARQAHQDATGHSRFRRRLAASGR